MAGKPEERSIENPESHSKKAGRERGRKKARHPLIEKHPVLGRIGTGLAAAALAAVACAPAARSQETTPSARTTQVAQSPDARVAPATTGTAPPRPAAVVAQAERPNVATYDQASVGAAPPQATPITEQDAVSSLNSLLQSSRAYEIDPFSAQPQNWRIVLDDGVLHTDPYLAVLIYAKTPQGEVQIFGDLFDKTAPFSIFELPTTETDVVGPGVLLLVTNKGSLLFYYDKAQQPAKRGVDFITSLPDEKPIAAVELLNDGKAVNVFAVPSSSVTRNRQNAITGINSGSLIEASSILLDQQSSVTNGPAAYSETYGVI